jgi:hypothetical protein
MADEWDKIELIEEPKFEYVAKCIIPQRWIDIKEAVVAAKETIIEPDQPTKPIEKEKVEAVVEKKQPLSCDRISQNRGRARNLSKPRVYDLETEERLQMLLLAIKFARAAGYDEKSHMD